MCSIHVEDPPTAYKFYTEILGFEVLLAVPEANLYIVTSPEDPTKLGLLLEPSDNQVARDYMEGLHALGMPVIVLGVDDVKTEFARLSALGVRFTSEPASGESGTSAVFDDTCGNYVQIHQDA